MSRQYYELKIESGFSGGAMALCKADEIIDRWIDEPPTVKSDFLLEAIAMLLERNKIDARNIRKIFFAENMRSQTAYKIAVSIFKGISIVSGAEIISKNLFEAIASYFSEKVQGELLIILQSAPEKFALAFFDENLKKISSADVGLDALPETFETMTRRRGKFTLLRSTGFESLIFEQKIKRLRIEGIEIIELGKNLSVYL